MGSLYKHKTVRWVDANKRRVPAGTPGAKKKVEISKSWWAKYLDANGEEHRESLNAKDKGNARKLLNDIERNVERERAGVIDHHLKHVKRPLSEHLDDWIESLKQRRITNKRRVEMEQRMRKLIRLSGWQRLTDITDDSTRKYLNQLDVSVQTWNHYLQHLKQFIRWCVPERLQVNPIAKFSRENVATDRRHDRRLLTDVEVAKLLSHTAKSTVIRFGLNGERRSMLYATALCTGFRRGELQSLTRESFDLENKTVTVAAAYSKHRRKDTQSLPPDLVELLKKWFANDKPLWPDLTPHSAKMIRADLEAAGIAYRVEATDGPLFADFHSLRHTFSTAVGNTDAPLADQMRVTRHSSYEVFKRYHKSTAESKAKCVNQVQMPLNVLAEPTSPES